MAWSLYLECFLEIWFIALFFKSAVLVHLSLLQSCTESLPEMSRCEHCRHRANSMCSLGTRNMDPCVGRAPRLWRKWLSLSPNRRHAEATRMFPNTLTCVGQFCCDKFTFPVIRLTAGVTRPPLVPHSPVALERPFIW
jgi:hypothetical protein